MIGDTRLNLHFLVKLYYDIRGPTGCLKKVANRILGALLHFPLEANYTGHEMTLLRNVFFWSFLTNTKQDKSLRGDIHAKNSPKAPIFGYDFGPIIMSATFCLRHPV